MSVPKEDYDKYLKHILENEAIWNDDGAFNEALYSLPTDLAFDKRANDAYVIIGELLSRRRELRKKYKQDHPDKYYLYETDENGELTGEYELIEDIARL